MANVTEKNYDYFANLLKKNPKKLTIISLLVIGHPKKWLLRYSLLAPPPKKKYRLTRCSLLSLKKSFDYFVSRYCPLKK